MFRRQPFNLVKPIDAIQVNNHAVVKMLLGVVAAGLLAVILQPRSVQAQGGSVLSGVSGEQVFEITLALNGNTDYHHFMFIDEYRGFCDLDRQARFQACNVDLAAIAQQLQQISALEYVRDLPPSVHWNTDEATPILLNAVIKQWNTETDQAQRWTLTCAIVPDSPAQSACFLVDRVDHFNYVMVGTEQLLRVIDSLQS